MSSIKKIRTTDGDMSIDYNSLDNLPTIPSKISELENDSEYINKNVGNLINYYSKDEINNMNLIDNNDIASVTKAGIIKITENYGTNVSEDGSLNGKVRTLEQYQEDSNYLFVSKGTLENIKTKTITKESSDIEIPTAKAVYNLTKNLKIKILTQEQYDEIPIKDEETLYFII